MNPLAHPSGQLPGLPPGTGWSIKRIMLRSQFNNQLSQIYWNNTLMYVIYHLFNPLILYDGGQGTTAAKGKTQHLDVFSFIFIES